MDPAIAIARPRSRQLFHSHPQGRLPAARGRVAKGTPAKIERGTDLSLRPANPGNAGLIDMGPFTGTWYLVVYVYLLIQLRRVAPGTERIA